MRCKVFLYIFFFFAGLIVVHDAAYAASATISNPLPAANVPPGATVTFTISAEGFTNPVYQLVDSFPGGASSSHLSGHYFSWTPNYSDIGTHTMTVTASDSEDNLATAETTIIVEGPPALEIESLSPSAHVNVGITVSFSVSPYGMWKPVYSKSDSFPQSSVNSYAVLNGKGEFFWTPLAHDIGTHTITITGVGEYENEASVDQEIIVLPSATLSFVNISPDTSVYAESKFSFTATTTGLVNPIFEISDSFYLGTSTISIDTKGVATWTPAANDVGKHTFTVTATDDDDRVKTEKLTVTVFEALPESSTQSSAPAPETGSDTPAQTGAGGTSASPPVSGGSSSYAAPAPSTAPRPVDSGGKLAYPLEEKTHPSLSIESDAENIEFLEPEKESFAAFIARSITDFFSSMFTFFIRSE